MVSIGFIEGHDKRISAEITYGVYPVKVIISIRVETDEYVEHESIWLNTRSSQRLNPSRNCIILAVAVPGEMNTLVLLHARERTSGIVSNQSDIESFPDDVNPCL